jgi:hypothetical protein
MDYRELCTVQKPETLPQRCCDIGYLSCRNMEVFGALLYPSCSGAKVVYNGHDANVRSRIRAHFATDTSSTGALGLRHYPLSQWRWTVRLFSTPHFSEEISYKDRLQIDSLMNSSSGRCAVEHAWRVRYGWPILCKA